MTRDPHCDGCKADDKLRALRRERDELQARLDAAVTALRWLPSQYTVADENALRVVSLLQDDVYRIADDLARPVSPETTP